MFVEMKRDGKMLNRSAFTCVLSICAEIASLEFGYMVALSRPDLRWDAM